MLEVLFGPTKIIWAAPTPDRAGAGPTPRRRPIVKAPAQQGVLSSRRRPDSKAAQPQETGSTPRDRLSQQIVLTTTRPRGEADRSGSMPVSVSAPRSASGFPSGDFP
jgi:hypothetical protein